MDVVLFLTISDHVVSKSGWRGVSAHCAESRLLTARVRENLPRDCQRTIMPNASGHASPLCTHCPQHPAPWPSITPNCDPCGDIV